VHLPNSQLTFGKLTKLQLTWVYFSTDKAPGKRRLYAGMQRAMCVVEE